LDKKCIELLVRWRYKKRADEGTRTLDPRLTMAVLYQLSYVGLALASYRRRTGRGEADLAEAGSSS
jgi:hypothetical protein